MTKQNVGDHGRRGGAASSEPLAGAVAETNEALAAGEVDEVRAKAVTTAANLYREGRTFLANHEEVAQATAEVSEAIRRNPLAAVGIAFTAGLVLALLTRG